MIFGCKVIVYYYNSKTFIYVLQHKLKNMLSNMLDDFVEKEGTRTFATKKESYYEKMYWVVFVSMDDAMFLCM